MPSRAGRWIERGDTIGVVAPGFAVPTEPLEAGVRRLEQLGYRVRVGEYVLARDGYLAGSDEQRATDLDSMLRDGDVRAVWFARGGYGTARLLDRVPWSAYRRDPKPLIGYSDLTALFAAASKRGDGVCLYAPVVTELGDRGAYHHASLRAALAGRPAAIPFHRRAVLAAGRAAGPLRGGNLSVLAHLCGTRHMPRLDGAILLLEDTGEETYRVDRMLTQLRQCGAFERVAAVVVGTLDVPPRERFPGDRPLRAVLEEALLPLGVPVVAGLPIGHRRGKRTVPLGLAARLDTARGRLEFRG